MARTEAELAKEAMEVQNACNLSGVIHSFSRALEDLWVISRERGKGTDWVNRHPVSVAYGSKIESLTQCRDGDRLEYSFDKIEKLLNPTTIEIMEDQCR